MAKAKTVIASDVPVPPSAERKERSDLNENMSCGTQLIFRIHPEPREGSLTLSGINSAGQSVFSNLWPYLGCYVAAVTLLRKAKQRRLLAVTLFLVFCIFLIGCSVPPARIPGIPKDHPAQKFYQAAQTGMLSDRVCRDNRGDPSIPIGKIEQGQGYTKLGNLTDGVFRFRETATGKQYLGVSFFQYSGFLQIPKVCAWEEKDRG